MVIPRNMVAVIAKIHNVRKQTSMERREGSGFVSKHEGHTLVSVSVLFVAFRLLSVMTEMLMLVVVPSGVSVPVLFSLPVVAVEFVNLCIFSCVVE